MGALLELVPMKYVVGILGALVLVTGCYLGYEHWANSLRAEGAAPYITAIAKQKADAAALLANLTTKNAAKEKALQDFTNLSNERDDLHEKTEDILAGKLAAANVAGRMRDPNAGCGSGGASPGGQVAASADPGGKDAAQADGLLSAELTGLLARLTKEADTINDAYASCRTDAYKVRE